MTITITRLYPSHAEAHAVVEALRAANVGDRNISVLASNADEWHRDKTPATYPDKDFDGRDDRAEAAAGGAGVGAAVGGTVGALTGLGLMAIPGVGPIVAAGWLVATLAEQPRVARPAASSAHSPKLERRLRKRKSTQKAFAAAARSSACAWTRQIGPA